MSESTSSIPQSLPAPKSLNLVSYPRKKEYPSCPNCLLTFSKESELKLHMSERGWKRYVEDNFGDNLVCEECCMFFETTKGYMQHLGKMHESNSKSSQCPFCDKKFKNKYAVQFHVNQVHEKNTREKCPCCDKEFYNKYMLPKHLLKCPMNALRFR